MRFPLGWLGELCDLPPLDALSERLTLAGCEIEDVLRTGPDLSQIRVGHVLERRQHPNADRLSVCRVELGQGEPVQVVCGAPNVAAGQKVAVAVPGVVLPDGTKLAKSKIRGETSEGMICSARELGLGDDHAGILVLDPAAAIGAPLDSLLAAGDTILDVEITPNRGDWVSLLGMAREVRALFGGPVRIPPHEPVEGTREARDDVRVAIEDRAACYRYVARVVRGVQVGPSPAWLRAKLEAAGMRTINVVVDVTNLVMLELGQPLHAFDLSTLRGGEIRVRAAREGEKLVTLDGETRTLASADLVIADAERAIAVAGVMGGAETEVREATHDVLIESANFAPTRVRRTRRRLGLASEASYRFERGVDREGQARAADRAARLLAELAGGTVSRGRVEALGDAPPGVPEIALDPRHPNRLLGTSLSAEEIVALLARVGVRAELVLGGRLRCSVPSWRNDLALPHDLIEEIARIHGYDRIEPTLPRAALAPVAVPPARALLERARDLLAQSGLTELRLHPGMFPEELERLRIPEGDPLRRAPRIANPMPGTPPLLPTTLVAGLLRATQRNLARQVDSLAVFEAGRVFRTGAAGELPDESLSAAALVLRGERADLWDPAAPAPAFFAAKGIAEGVLEALGVRTTFCSDTDRPWLHPGASGGFAVGDQRVCRVGELHPDVAGAFGIAGACALVELDLQALLALPSEPVAFRDVSQYPAVRRDLAVLLDTSRPAGEVLGAIRKSAGQTLVSAAIFDRYEGKGVPPGKVSIAFRLVFQRPDRTLQDEEVAKTTARVVHMLGERFGGELR